MTAQVFDVGVLRCATLFGADETPEPRERGREKLSDPSRLVSLSVFLLLVVGHVDSARGEPALPQRLLAEALENLYPNGHERVQFVNYTGDRRGFQQEIQVSIKKSDGTYRVLGVFTSPPSVRGTAFLILPPTEPAAEDSRVPANDYFVYLPALGKVRRISGAQRADSFFGTLLSQGDVEPHPGTHYQVASMREAKLEGEPVYELDAKPLFEGGYDRVRFAIAQKDLAVLRVEQYREGDEVAIRTMETRRAWVEEIDGYALPARVIVADGRRRRSTEVVFSDRRLKEDIPDTLFSVDQLIRKGH